MSRVRYLLDPVTYKTFTGSCAIALPLFSKCHLPYGDLATIWRHFHKNGLAYKDVSDATMALLQSKDKHKPPTRAHVKTNG